MVSKRVYPYPLVVGSARPNPKMGAPDPENPLFVRFSGLKGGSETMVSDHGLGRGQTMGRGRSGDCESVVSKRVVLAIVPGPQKPERGYKNGTTVPKTGTRAHSPKPPFYNIALLFPLERSVTSGFLRFRAQVREIQIPWARNSSKISSKDPTWPPPPLCLNKLKK